MFIQIGGSFYLNTNKITVLGVFELPQQNQYQIGIVINEGKYPIYNVNGIVTPGLKKDLQEAVESVIHEIIKQTKETVVKIEVPVLDVQKYKEQIND